MAFILFDLILERALFNFSLFLPQITTLQPSSINLFTISKPIPLTPAVTTTFLTLGTTYIILYLRK